tara:strand:+ start:323 stop:1747 length:1425 start_codon:yes stop_codon:yes gene_type:complete
MMILKKIPIAVFVIFVSFIFSIIISSHNLKNYDKNVEDDGVIYHQMIKQDALRYMGHGAYIKEDLKKGVNYFKTGNENYTKYLPPRIAALYYYVFDIDLFNNFDEKKINIGVHFPYLIIQCLFYFFSVFVLYNSISKILDKKICLLIVSFLSFEPTIFQYHTSFYSESIFFSLQILLIALIIKEKHSILNFFVVGFLLAILSMQKQMAIFYIIPIVIYFAIFLKQSRLIKILFILIGYTLVQSFLGYHNFQRSGEFYIMTADTKIDLHRYLVVRVVPEKYNVSPQEWESLEGKIMERWMNNNLVSYDEKLLSSIKNPNYMQYRETIYNENDKTRFDNYLRSRTFEYFQKYPLDFFFTIMKGSIHTTLLNPFHIYSDNHFATGERYYLSDTRSKLIPYRVIYSIIIYTICLFGLFTLIKEKKVPLLFYLIISILYFFGLISWHGDTRYFVPVMIYLSFFFGIGLNKIISDKKKIN